MKTIQLTQGCTALLDDEDFERLARFNWYAFGAYAARSYALPKGKRGNLFLHHAVMDCDTRTRIDHRDGNGLNNQKDNLRLATHAQNMRNRRKPVGYHGSKYKGVYPRKDRGTWVCQIKCDNKTYRSYWKTELEAALAYDQLAIQLHGDFARLNFSYN